MPGQIARNLEPLAWFQADYEQQIALKAHLDSLAVELSLLRSDVVNVLQRRSRRQREIEIFRAWRFASRSEAFRAFRAAGGAHDAVLLLVAIPPAACAGHWRLAAHREHKPLNLGAFPSWRLQLFLWAWRAAVGGRTLRRVDEQVTQRLLSPRHRQVSQVESLLKKAANALRTLRDHDLLYFILQAIPFLVFSQACYEDYQIWCVAHVYI